MTRKIVTDDDIRARWEFDIKNDVLPCRTVALNITGHYGIDPTSSIVDDIAIEDARNVGEKRGRLNIK